jgi:hypothetical protein
MYATISSYWKIYLEQQKEPFLGEVLKPEGVSAWDLERIYFYVCLQRRGDVLLSPDEIKKKQNNWFVPAHKKGSYFQKFLQIIKFIRGNFDEIFLEKPLDILDLKIKEYKKCLRSF